MTRILVLLGSLRAASVNRQLAEAAAELAPQGIHVELFDRLGELPHYNEDIDTTDVAEPVEALREVSGQSDGVLVITPEYNATIPGALKNAIDWLSRPYGNGALNGKPLAVIGTSLGSYGGTWAHDDTRKSFAIAGARVIDSIRLSIPSKTLAGAHPRDHPDTIAKLTAALTELVAEVGPDPRSRDAQ